MLLKEIKKFLLHLRLNYQIFILSGPYLLGGLLSPQLNSIAFMLQFLNVHILLFGGVTAYNSYWDKDTGPIGGLKHPPKMKPWMLYASWAFQIAGLLLALLTGFFFAMMYVISIIFFWLYSSPTTRWKGRPIMSLIAIGISTGVCSFLMGHFAFGGSSVSATQLISSIGISLLILAMFPVSQAYQISEDNKRKDITFAVRFGLKGVKKLYSILFPVGILMVFLGIYWIKTYLSFIYLAVGIVAYLINYYQIKSLRGVESEYSKIMNMKYYSGSLLSIILVALIILL